MILETERLLLREFSMEDIDAVHAYASDIDVTRFTSFGPNSLVETKEFLERVVADATFTPRANIGLAVVERTTQRLIGSCGYEKSSVVGPQFAFGYVLHKEFWGKRYGTEVAEALRDFAFTQLGAHRLWAHVFVDNSNSARILRGLDFRPEGNALQSFYVRGKWHDLTTYAMLKSDWLALTG